MGKNVLVVGGPSDLVFGNLARNLGSHGIEVGWHASDFDGEGAPFTGIPSGCACVVVLVDMVSHPLHNKVAAAAKKARVPLGRVPRKWSIAEGLLRAQGVLEPAVNGNAPKLVNRTTIKQTALAYIIEERKAGRNPKKGEVEAAVQRAMGPKTKLYKDEYSRAKRMAANETPIIKAKPLPAPQDMTKEVRDWAMFLIDEDPARVHNVGGLIKLVSQHSEVRFGAAKSTIEEAAEETILRWTRKTPEDRAFRDRMIVGWLRRWFKRWHKSSQDYPDSRTIDTRCRQVFGVRPSREAIREARAQAMGEWARNLIYAKKAQEHADARWGHLDLNILNLMERGLLHFIPTRKMPMTSKLAVDELARDVEAGRVSLDPPEPEVEVIPESEPAPTPVVVVPETAPEPQPVTISPTPATREEDMFTLATIVEEAVSQKLRELLAPIESRLVAIEEKLEAGGAQVDGAALLDRVLNGSEVTGITVSLDPNSLRKKP